MDSQHIFFPMLAQIGLTLGMYITLALRKSKALKANALNIKDAALDNKAWPDSVVKVSNNIANQFESPVLFYALCLILFAINGVTLLSVALAWAFIALRYLHARIHIGSNHVPKRLWVFVMSQAVLLSMTALAGWQLITLTSP